MITDRQSIVIYNIAEVAFLLDRNNRIDDAWLEAAHEASGTFVVRMSGLELWNDHGEFMCLHPCQLDRMKMAFDAILEAVRANEAKKRARKESCK